MSYGHPCSRMTAGPPAGPASAYPTSSTPARICLRLPNDLIGPGSREGGFDGLVVLDRASREAKRPNSAAASVMAAEPRKWRRPLSTGIATLPPAADQCRVLVRA